MKTIGLLCGLSWLSTIEYYRKMNQTISKAHGAQTSAKILMNSLNAGIVYDLFREKKYHDLTKLLIAESYRLVSAGADYIAITCNSVHQFYSDIQEVIPVPVIHILEPLVKKLCENNIKKVGLLGTRFTIESKFYSRYLSQFGITVVYPHDEDITLVDKAIFNYCSSVENIELKQLKLRLNCIFHEDDVDAIVLGCTELGIMLDGAREYFSVIDVASLHAEKLAYMSVEESEHAHLGTTANKQAIRLVYDDLNYDHVHKSC